MERAVSAVPGAACHGGDGRDARAPGGSAAATPSTNRDPISESRHDGPTIAHEWSIVISRTVYSPSTPIDGAQVGWHNY